MNHKQYVKHPQELVGLFRMQIFKRFLNLCDSEKYDGQQ